MEDVRILKCYREVAALPEGTPLPAHPARTGPPLQLLNVYNSDEESPDFSQPFIYRQFPWLPADPRLFETLLRGETEVYGYHLAPLDNSPDWDDATFPGALVWEQFLNRSLKINIIDSECSEKGPLLDGWHSGILGVPWSVGWVLTVAPKRTYFHVDPPCGDCFMYLCQGRKIWLFIPPAAMAEVESRHGFEIVNRLPLPELLLLDDAFLWGKMLIGEIGDGDFIFFPENWPHYVRTLEHSFGYGGYFEKAPHDN